jgi:DNA-binding NarL/FixJ family response regulator
MNDEIQIVIADDHPIFRRGLRAMIESEPNLKVIAETDNGETAVAYIIEHEPDIAVLDVDMPGKDGFEVAREIYGKNLATEIIFLTMHNSEQLFNAALDAGAKGFVLKDGALPEITDCIKAVAAGKNYISPQLSTYLFNRSNRADLFIRNKPSLRDLTPAEQKILKQIADDKTSRQIAEELFISIRTVDRHRANICEKLDLRGTNALVRFAVAHKSELG